jgi:hypothetical protein
MTCPTHHFKHRYPNSDVEVWLRFLAGHRVISESHLDDVAAHIRDSYNLDAQWIGYLASGWKVPFFESAYTIVQGDRDVDGTLRLRLTAAGWRAVDIWLKAGEVEGPLAGDCGWVKPIMLQLWGAGCGIPSGHWARTARARREVLSRFFQGPTDRVSCIVQSNKSALEIRDLNRRLAKISQRDEAVLLGIPGEEFDPRRTSLLVASLASQPASPIEITRRARTKKGLGRFLVMEAKGWIAPRRLSNEAGEWLDTDAVSADDQFFLQYLASRSSNKRSAAPPTPFGRNKQAELSSLKITQSVIGAVLRAHPTEVDFTASLWSVSPVYVFSDDHHYGGLPTGLDQISEAGINHPMIRSTQRILDGALFMSGDSPFRPRLWIEHEAGRTHSRVQHHLAAALQRSSRWNRTIDLVIVVTSAARKVVEREIHSFLQSRYFEHSGQFEAPGARVNLHVVGERVAQRGCPLHGPALLREEVRIPGDTWALRARLLGSVGTDARDASDPSF